MDAATRQAFQTLWEDCTPEQHALRETWLPRREGDAAAEYDAELLRRHLAGLPLSIEAKRKARFLERGQQR
jgi:hypothetical protein